MNCNNSEKSHGHHWEQLIRTATQCETVVKRSKGYNRIQMENSTENSLMPLYKSEVNLHLEQCVLYWSSDLKKHIVAVKASTQNISPWSVLDEQCNMLPLLPKYNFFVKSDEQTLYWNTTKRFKLA